MAGSIAPRTRACAALAAVDTTAGQSRRRRRAACPRVLPPGPGFDCPMSADWLRDAVIYEIYPQSYADSDGDGIGDLRGVLAHLDHLEALADKLVATEDSLKLAHQQVSSLLAVVEELRK